jgi:DNA polymerase
MQLAFNLVTTEVFEQENAAEVMKELCDTCTDCRLSRAHPFNRGMVYRGNINAKIAVVGTAPGDAETEKGSAMVGPSGKEFEKWMSYLNLDSRKDIFVTNIIQCQPPRKKQRDGRSKQQDPEKDEITACFGPRCLRVLRAMPNLSVVMTLGWLAAKAFLGTNGGLSEPRIKTHEGGWFESSLLPGIPIFCLSHPAELLRSDSDDRRMTIQNLLDCFRREYLQSGKVSDLAKAARQEREEKGIFQ